MHTRVQTHANCFPESKTPMHCEQTDFSPALEDGSAGGTSVQLLTDHFIVIQGSKCCSCMHMAPSVTFRRRGGLLSLHHIDIQLHEVHVIIGSFFPLLSGLPRLPPPGRWEKWCSLLSDCYSSIPLSPLSQPIGYS